MTDTLDAPWKPKYNPWLIALTVTLATFMEVLDTSIANVSLPHIAGNLSASQEESAWVLTSYLVSNAIILPISAWLSTIIGRKRFYMSCVALFTVSSFLCGLAPSLGMLIFFRILQGVGGGGLQPSEQAILADTFPASKRGMAFAVYGMAVVLAPAIGPTLGGYITDNYNWRWIFYINVPIGLLSLFLTNRLVEDPPFLKREQERRRGIRADYVGLGLITLAIASLQIALDKGQESDWFSSRWITSLVVLAGYAFLVWIVWEWHHPNPVVDIRLFKRRNFATAMFFSFTVGIVLYGTTFMIPQFLQVQLGYPAVVAGEALAGGGFIMIMVLPFVGTMVSRVDPRKMMAFGFVSISAAMYYMSSSVQPHHGFPRGIFDAHAADVRAGVHFRPAECSGLRGHPAREEQPDFFHEQLHAQRRRKHRNRADLDFDCARRPAAPLFDGRARDARNAAVRQPRGRADSDFARERSGQRRRHAAGARNRFLHD